MSIHMVVEPREKGSDKSKDNHLDLLHNSPPLVSTIASTGFSHIFIPNCLVCVIRWLVPILGCRLSLCQKLIMNKGKHETISDTNLKLMLTESLYQTNEIQPKRKLRNKPHQLPRNRWVPKLHHKLHLLYHKFSPKQAHAKFNMHKMYANNTCWSSVVTLLPGSRNIFSPGCRSWWMRGCCCSLHTLRKPSYNWCQGSSLVSAKHFNW